ncbi:MAG: hypothetical protein D6800_14380 [Candidatus Zixiibacteriota bacterium]|nr:MAG: hypothetical protein D6800_14380 [candidate division Zixibacteria bacterium]
MKRIVVSTVLCFLALSLSAHAFDGNRKGFVIGGGLGLAPVSSWSLQNSPFDENRAGIGLNLIIGYAWDNHNMIVYEGNVVGYSSRFDGFRTNNGLGVIENKPNIGQGYNGASWYHYFTEIGHSWFTVAGLGVYTMDVENLNSNDPGPGILLGGGYEFAPHYQIGLYLSAGSSSNGMSDYDNAHLSVLFTAIAF